MLSCHTPTITAEDATHPTRRNRHCTEASPLEASKMRSNLLEARIRVDVDLFTHVLGGDAAEELSLGLDALALDLAVGLAPLGGIGDRGHEEEPEPRVKSLFEGSGLVAARQLGLAHAAADLDELVKAELGRVVGGVAARPRVDLVDLVVHVDQHEE